MQASDRRALRPDHTVRQAYVDRHFATSVHAADRHARTGGWRGSEFNVPRRRVIAVWFGDVLVKVDMLHADYVK